MKKGFTLAELLTVVLIIAILASLLFPVFGGSKVKAQSIRCISNMRQLYTAINLYEGDFGSYPPNTVVWPGLKPYYPQVLTCPASTKPAYLRGEADYLLFASPPPGDATNIQHYDQCRDLRGPALPIIWDDNHLGAKYGASTGQSFLLLVRLDGSAHRIESQVVSQTFAQSYAGNAPCFNPPFPEMNL